ncbi:2,4-dienoyl-CoA reductase [Alteromonas sp. MB-3u-76]|jgi:2,4-dienoyl-CoA reductase-like NADH-dependent reductase (Old Yellow Enzyme family)|uniref:NADH:flavin oxidoreductase/NADH oxidase family protein n=1 Tax=unclassified Alteromonas TaxID=2614992 RepID=UPI0009039FBF|nr:MULTISPECIES: NADH:flavin oxidoreductase/NADH oxidase family protein [unclassified Alteromonas]APE06141.1 2,4-dienoyl-CoA reductase [Alteromonas sp. RW2A1]AUC88550.1 2,4-dienoyl-CoA reductase [Alteromonas sp. MB-3u-76]
MPSNSILYSPYTLPCGKTVRNRLVKAAMEENMSSYGCLPGESLFSLYRYWAHGDLGMVITGNVMVDKEAMTGPGGVVLEKDTPLAPFERWAKIIKSNGALAVMQINHPGRQVFKAMQGKAIAPSAIPLDMGKHSKLFAEPREMTCQDIHDVCKRFVETAKQAEKAGFDGVEVHAAHGYLLTQFLSPLTNQRQDEWGGSIINRARLLINIVSQIRAVCAKDFIVMVKLNSADFQKNGFSFDDASEVVNRLEALGVDVVELSGGSYEAPAMQGQTKDNTTLAREAYFLEFAKTLESQTQIPLMTTGGIKRAEIAERVIQEGCELVGLASALAITPNLAKKWQQEWTYSGVIPHCTWKDKSLASLANMAIVRRQLRRLGNDLTTLRSPSPLWSLVLDLVHRKKMTKRDVAYRSEK